ncbi:MAG: GMC family oxidoreductase [Acidobacteriota bacterium]
MPRYESDVCIIGSGISATLVAQVLAERKPGLSIQLVEAGRSFFDQTRRREWRQRALDYGENPYPGDVIEDQQAQGIISRTQAVGGLAIHFGGVMQRFSEEDTRLESMYGLAYDWPIEWAELERYYVAAEKRIGVAGEPGPYPEDRRSEPYPMPAMELTWNLQQLKTWAEKTGTRFCSTPVCKNTVPYDGRNVCVRCDTCNMCPTGARYSPDLQLRRLLDAKKIALHDRTLVRRLIVDDTGSRIVAAQGVHEDRPDDPAEYRAQTFVIAAGYAWSSHLLLLSATSRFPNGLANRSGLVGRYMGGHKFISAILEMDAEIYPGMFGGHSLVSRRFFRCDPKGFFVRHDFRVWDAAHQPRLRDENGKLLLGDAMMDDWRARAKRGRARVRMYYDVHPDRDSRLTLDPSRKNRHGDPLPAITHQLDAATRAREDRTRQHILGLYDELAKHDNGRIISTQFGDYLDHPTGGCRMGTDPADSVTDSYGRTHDHENLWVVGAPTLPTGGCANGTLTFAALTIRSAEKM